MSEINFDPNKLDMKHPGDTSDHPLTPEEKAAAHSRRTFLFKLAVGLNALVGAVLAVPIVGYLLGPALRKSSTTGSWVALGAVDSFPLNDYRLTDFLSPVHRPEDGQTGKIPCWVRREGAQDFKVFAINCAHLGCPVRWFSQSRLFMCPCHGGAYYEDGSRASGPPERGLFAYRTKVENNQLYIHSGDMPTLATEAKCTGKPLVQLEPAGEGTSQSLSRNGGRSSSWQA